MIYSNTNSIKEAKAIQGQEYDIVRNKVDIKGDTINDDENTIKAASTSIGKGGILDSVAQNRIKDLDIEKENSTSESTFELFDNFLLESYGYEDYITEAEDDEEDTEYSLDDNEEENKNPAAPANASQETEEPNEPEPANEPVDDEGEDTEYSLDDNQDDNVNEPENTEGENNQTEEAPEEGKEDTEYELPDDEEQQSEEDRNTDDGPPEDDDDVNYSMDGDTTNGDTGNNTDDNQDDTSSEDLDSSDENSKMKDLESVIFDELNPEEKKLKVKELKELYNLVYLKCGSISEKVSDIKKDEQTIQIVEYISNTLVDLKKYILDYTTDIFDSKTYVENLAQLQKYLAIFNAINKVFAEIRSENE